MIILFGATAAHILQSEAPQKIHEGVLVTTRRIKRILAAFVIAGGISAASFTTSSAFAATAGPSSSNHATVITNANTRLFCSVSTGTTNNRRETVSASGNAPFTCI